MGRDESSPAVEVPDDLAAALDEAKRPGTRARRVAGTVERLATPRGR